VIAVYFINQLPLLLAEPIGAILPTTPMATLGWDALIKVLDPLVIFVVLMILTYLFKRRNQAKLDDLALRLGFEFKPDSNSVRSLHDSSSVVGLHRKRAIRFFMHQNPGEKNRIWMAVTAAVDTNKVPVGAFLYVAPNIWSLRAAWKLAPFSANKTMGIIPSGWDIDWKEMKGLSTDDEIFDRAFLVKTNNPEWTRALLDAEARQTLLTKRQEPKVLIGLQNNRGMVSLRINANEVRYSVPGSFGEAKQVDHLITHMDFICKLADQAESLAPRGLTSASGSVQLRKSYSSPVQSEDFDSTHARRPMAKKLLGKPAAIALSIALGLISTVLIEVVPEFEKSYTNSHAQLSASAQFLFGASHFLRFWWWALCLGGFALVRFYKRMAAISNESANPR